jgi:hypothetical protein
MPVSPVSYPTTPGLKSSLQHCKQSSLNLTPLPVLDEQRKNSIDTTESYGNSSQAADALNSVKYTDVSFSPAGSYDLDTGISAPVLDRENSISKGSISTNNSREQKNGNYFIIFFFFLPMIQVAIQILTLQIILQVHPLRLLLLLHKTLISTTPKKNNRVTTKKRPQYRLHFHIQLFHLLGSLTTTTTLT